MTIYYGLSAIRPWDDGITVSRHLVTGYDVDDDPLSLGLVRDQHLRVTNGGNEDGYIDHLINVSLRTAQRRTQRRILRETWKLHLSAFPWGRIELPYPPLIEVSSVTYLDDDGDEQTLDADEYIVTAPQGPEAGRGHIRLVDGGTWPTAATRQDAVRVTFRCGYVDTSVSPEVVDVPVELNHARLLVITDLYENRGSQNVGAGVSVSHNLMTANELFEAYRDRTVAG